MTRHLLSLAALLILSGQALAQQGQRPQIALSCVSYGMGPMLECTVDLKRRDGTPLDGVQLTLGALMPSMPMAHTIKPVRAIPSGIPGQYRGTLELEMLGVWTVDIDISGSARDKTSRSLLVQECMGSARCVATPTQSGKPGGNTHGMHRQ